MLPATVHSHIRHYIYFGEPLEFSLRLQSVLPASHFHPLYLDFRKTVGLTTPLPWAYDIFSIVVEEYGQQLHDVIVIALRGRLILTYFLCSEP